MNATEFYTPHDPLQAHQPTYCGPANHPSVPHQEYHQPPHALAQGHTAATLTTHISPASHSHHLPQDSHIGTFHPVTINNHLGTTNYTSAVNALPNYSQISSANTNNPSSQSNNPLMTLSSIANLHDTISYLKQDSPTIPQDHNLDQDAPHVDDDGGSDNESPFINIPTSADHTYQEGTINSSHHPLINNNSSLHHSWPHPQLSDHHEADQKPKILAQIAPSSGRKRKRNSEQSISINTPTRPESGRPKQTPRVKSAEQLATEALIEQENPHASKNELRSLKLRALHAVRIAEREVNMPEAEKQRRQRLREYVRQKRAEERSHKAKHENNPGQSTNLSQKSLAHHSAHSTHTCLTHSSDHTESKPIRKKSRTQSNRLKNKIDPSFHPQEETQPIATRLPLTESHPNQPQADPVSSPTNLSSSHELRPIDNPSAANSHGPDSKQKGKKKKTQKVPVRNSVPRTTLRATSLEAEIKKQNPHATRIQLKSLKLRALHAERIAEREQNMSEKDKTRRAKLREYMRKRRDEERLEKGLESVELSPLTVEVKPASGPVLQYQGTQDLSTTSPCIGEGHVHTQNEGAMTSLSAATTLVPEGMSADDGLAALSMMELTNSYQQPFTQSHALSVHNTHLHPLFQMPIGGSSSLEVPSPYDCSMSTGYSVMAEEQWTQMLPTDAVVRGEEQEVLHNVVGLTEVSYMEHDETHLVGDDEPAHYVTEEQQTVESGSLEHQNRMLLAEEDILGMERARELAMIAAAAAEVEHAQQMTCSSSSHHLG
ncbi:hypothetical protein VP01_1570g2 [Puccinia sorghi]|uniref:Uncharacterized protein n=1 Tax=Puccinia sorghi TaxID=27349 RepID=A0A0L6VJL2_9BASI|nr:hypothetical protein VP01_1570g2 [Puccinia sorghi]